MSSPESKSKAKKLAGAAIVGAAALGVGTKVVQEVVGRMETTKQATKNATEGKAKAPGSKEKAAKKKATRVALNPECQALLDDISRRLEVPQEVAMHAALAYYAGLPLYPLDDGPLTDEQFNKLQGVISQAPTGQPLSSLF